MKKKIKLRTVDDANHLVAWNKVGSLETHKWVWWMRHITPNEKRQLPDGSDSKLKGLLLMAKESPINVKDYTCRKNRQSLRAINNPYPTAFPYRNGMVLHFYQQQESSTTKTVHKVINKGLKTYV